MAGGEWVPKTTLIDQIRRTMIDGESGVFTILTDKKRSIMFRFSEGKLIHSHCRSRDVNDAIIALGECAELKFSHSTTQPKDQDEIIAAEVFLQAISPGELVEQSVVPYSVQEPKTRPLVEKLEAPAAVSSEAFGQRAATLEEGKPAEETAQTEAPKAEGKPTPSEHRLFF